MNAPRDLNVPPHSLEAEQSVLGALLQSNEAWDRIAGLQESDFYRYDHRLIYQHIVKLINCARTADVITVFDSLSAAGKADEVGGLQYLNALAQNVPSSANIRHYAEIVRTNADKRGLIAAAMSAMDAVQGGADLAETIEKAQAAMMALTENRQTREPKHIGEILSGTVDQIDARYQGNDGPRGVCSGLHALDAKLNGMRAGEVYIMAGRPGMGKTAMALQVAHNAAIDENAPGAVLFLSQEMEAPELAERALALSGGIAYENIVSGRLCEEDWPRMTHGIQILNGGRLFIDDSPALTLRDVRAKAMGLKRKQGGLALVVIDYLQLMRGAGENRTQEIGAISRGLKRLAKDLKCPFLVLSQLSRKCEERQDKRPMLSDLRDSGDIEQDADCVMLLYRPVEYDPTFQPADLMEVNIAKKRNGKRGIVPLSYEGEFMRVSEYKGQWPLQEQSKRFANKPSVYPNGLD